MLLWDLYEIRCEGTEIHGVKLRGRIRKFSLEKDIVCLVENASDEENVVRFALFEHSDFAPISAFVETLLPGGQVTKVLTGIPNPVLSKLKVNDISRYEI